MRRNVNVTAEVDRATTTKKALARDLMPTRVVFCLCDFVLRNTAVAAAAAVAVALILSFCGDLINSAMISCLSITGTLLSFPA